MCNLCKKEEVIDSHSINWKSEYKRCLMDTTRIYMIEKYVFGKELLHSQNMILTHIKPHQTNVVSKSRDIGYTSIMAAYVACEMALNCDEAFDMMYIGFSGEMCAQFRIKVREYLSKIPKELYSNENVIIEHCNNKGIRVGKSYLRLTNGLGGENIIFSDTNSLCLKCVIFDEPAFLDKLDVAEIIDTVLYGICTTYIVGSNPNHNNLNWYKFVKRYKNTSGYIEIPWYFNQLHRIDENDIPELKIDPNEGGEYYTNIWHGKKRRIYFDTEVFDEEHNAKVWKYKTIKDYV